MRKTKPRRSSRCSREEWVRRTGARGVRGDEVQALGGKSGVQGEPGATGLEGGEDGDDQVQGALQADGDEDVGAHAEAAQVAGELVGAGVELAIGELLGAEAQGGGVRSAEHLGLEEAVDERGLGQLAPGLVPVHQHLLALGRGEQGQLGEARLGCVHHALHQHPQVLGHAGDGGGVEEVGVVVEAARRGPRECRRGRG